ncbi:hypothetical protein NON00_07175 [Roseomonas sp. GC11]|uniref:hypothetical protein n=1 Tax=Roseomonas sp. GC11 TaxID=2950546 RepID=UPI002109CE95|nr:hypothetical protein [Roseomonas sp. GC11]MCQ4159706.1 hypothetical protein [Roseomonas sp. GC11]
MTRRGRLGMAALLGLLLAAAAEIGGLMAREDALRRTALTLSPLLDTAQAGTNRAGLHRLARQLAPELEAERLSLLGEGEDRQLLYRQPLLTPLPWLLWGPEVALRAPLRLSPDKRPPRAGRYAGAASG